MDIFNEIQDKLDLKKLQPINHSESSGCISKGKGYYTDKGNIFIKFNKSKDAPLIFHGEFASLNAIRETQTIKVPEPLTCVLDPKSDGGALVLEYFDLKRITEWETFAQQIAALHLFNSLLGKKKAKLDSWVGRAKRSCPQDIPDEAKNFIEQKALFTIDDELIERLDYIDKFGFDVPTCCGSIPQNNEWHDDWIQFYARNRLDPQIKMITENYGDREIIEYWSNLQLKIDKFFNDCLRIEPSLLHGDMWSGNIGQIEKTPVVFDPSSYYGHSEFDLSIATLFGGFDKAFFVEYFKKIPKLKGFEMRNKLYQLFHTLNHWNHFGSNKRQTKDIMKHLLKME